MLIKLMTCGGDCGKALRRRRLSATAAALFIILPLSLHAYYALLGVLAVYVLAFAAANLWLSKTL